MDSNEADREDVVGAHDLLHKRPSKEALFAIMENDALHSKHPSLRSVQRCDLEHHVAHHRGWMCGEIGIL